MEVTYKQDMQNYYLIIQNIDPERENYSVSMLANNKIDGLLAVELRVIDNIQWFYFDITALITLKEVVQKNKLDYIFVKDLFNNIINIIKNSYEYLLEEKNFILLPEYIYIDNNPGKIQLCYLNGYSKDIHSQIIFLIEYLLDKIDYSEQKVVLLTYGMYQLVKEKNCTFSQLKEFINEQDKDREVSLLSDKEEKRKEKYKAELDIEKPLYIEKSGKKRIDMRKRKVICVLSGIIVFACVLGSGLLNNSMGLDIKKLVVGVFILFFGEGYAFICIAAKDRKKISPMNDGEGDKTVIFTETEEQAPIWRLSAENSEKYHDIVISEFPHFIGKLSSKVNSIIKNETVSRYHAKIECKNNNYYLTDLNSTNGTFVNGVRLNSYEPVRIEQGDLIAFAAVKYRFQKEF